MTSPYGHMNYCIRCKIWTCKHATRCPECGRRLRTKPRRAYRDFQTYTAISIAPVIVSRGRKSAAASP